MTSIFEALYPKVEGEGCRLDDETNTISEASHLNINSLAHPCEEDEVEEVQNKGTMPGKIQKQIIEKDRR
mgnify:CR=1 FL=1